MNFQSNGLTIELTRNDTGGTITLTMVKEDKIIGLEAVR
jgi:hypothetical protein